MDKEKIYFDLDHTLWDYDTNAKETLQEIFFEFEVNRYFVSARSFINVFYHVNYELWDLYNSGKIDKDYIRRTRFKKILEGRADYSDDEYMEISDFFIQECPRKGTLMPGAEDVLDAVSKKYRLGIITNGFDDTQHTKLNTSGISEYFELVVTSESAGTTKPDKKIFEYALNQSGLEKSQVVMIGDNLNTDIRGASDFGIDAIWYNPEKRSGEHLQEIQDLRELLDLI